MTSGTQLIVIVYGIITVIDCWCICPTNWLHYQQNPWQARSTSLLQEMRQQEGEQMVVARSCCCKAHPAPPGKKVESYRRWSCASVIPSSLSSRQQADQRFSWKTLRWSHWSNDEWFQATMDSCQRPTPLHWTSWSSDYWWMLKTSLSCSPTSLLTKLKRLNPHSSPTRLPHHLQILCNMIAYVMTAWPPYAQPPQVRSWICWPPCLWNHHLRIHFLLHFLSCAQTYLLKL